MSNLELWEQFKYKPFFEWFDSNRQETFSYHFSPKASEAYETLRDYLKYPFLQGRGLVPHLIYSQEEMFCIDPFNFSPPQIIKDREKSLLTINDSILDIYELRRRHLLKLHYAEDILLSMKKHASFKDPHKVALIFYMYDYPNTKAEDLTPELQKSIHKDMRYTGKTLNNVVSEIKRDYIKIKKNPYPQINNKGL